MFNVFKFNTARFNAFRPSSGERPLRIIGRPTIIRSRRSDTTLLTSHKNVIVQTEKRDATYLRTIDSHQIRQTNSNTIL